MRLAYVLWRPCPRTTEASGKVRRRIRGFSADNNDDSLARSADFCRNVIRACRRHRTQRRPGSLIYFRTATPELAIGTVARCRRPGVEVVLTRRSRAPAPTVRRRFLFRFPLRFFVFVTGFSRKRVAEESPQSRRKTDRLKTKPSRHKVAVP